MAKFQPRVQDEGRDDGLKEKMIAVNRVTKVVKGGRILGFAALTVVGDGTQTRDFIHVRDVAQALRLAAERGRIGEIYNVGSDRPVSVNRIVELIGAERIMHLPKRPAEPDCTLADTTKIKNDLGWCAEISIESGVSELLRYVNDWRGAPVWTADRIAEATQDWFRYLKP